MKADGYRWGGFAAPTFNAATSRTAIVSAAMATITLIAPATCIELVTSSGFHTPRKQSQSMNMRKLNVACVIIAGHRIPEFNV